MMKAIIERGLAGPRCKFRYAVENVRAFLEAGVPVLAGTDANHSPYAPVHVDHGGALHQELELLTIAGMTPAQALQSATSRAAEVFGLSDRGRIVPGCRADLLLVEGDPTAGIRMAENIREVWIAGVRREKRRRVLWR